MSSADRQCEFRFHEELNDFLAPARRQRSFVHAFTGTPAVKDRIESLGVPHTEVELILVDDAAVPFAHRLRGGERVAVYPLAAAADVALASAPRPLREPLAEPRFVLDVHLGRLAAYLRLLGFDCLYRNDYADEELLAIAQAAHRVLLTRDTGLLKRSAVVHGAFLHATDPRRQLREVLARFDLAGRIAPFTRCARCNGRVEQVAGNVAPEGVPATVARHHRDFSRCAACGQVYWPGSHLSRLRRRLAEAGVVV